MNFSFVPIWMIGTRWKSLTLENSCKHGPTSCSKIKNELFNRPTGIGSLCTRLCVVKMKRIDETCWPHTSEHLPYVLIQGEKIINATSELCSIFQMTNLERFWHLMCQFPVTQKPVVLRGWRSSLVEWLSSIRRVGVWAGPWAGLAPCMMPTYLNTQPMCPGL